jgi:hypothetical protein
MQRPFGCQIADSGANDKPNRKEDRSPAQKPAHSLHDQVFTMMASDLFPGWHAGFRDLNSPKAEAAQ